MTGVKTAQVDNPPYAWSKSAMAWGKTHSAYDYRLDLQQSDLAVGQYHGRYALWRGVRWACDLPPCRARRTAQGAQRTGGFHRRDNQRRLRGPARLYRDCNLGILYRRG